MATDLAAFQVGAKEGKSSLREAKEAGSQYDDYEMLTRQLGSEMKAKPSDRLKSEEELLVLEANRLKQLEVWSSLHRHFLVCRHTPHLS